jgi:hypothetical protein
MSLRWIRCFLTFGVVALSAQLCSGGAITNAQAPGGLLYAINPCGIPDTSGNTYTSPAALSLSGTQAGVSCSAYLSFGDVGVSLAGGSSEMTGVAADGVTVTGLNGDTLQVAWAVDGTFALDPAANGASDHLAYFVGTVPGGNQNLVAVMNQTLSSGNANAIDGSYSLTDEGNDTWDFSATGVTDLPIVNGWVDLIQSLYIDSNHGSLDFLHTGLVGAAVVLDSNGDVVPNATITSDSGFDYTQPLPNPAPEPATFGMIAAGLAVLAWRMRRISRRLADCATQASATAGRLLPRPPDCLSPICTSRTSGKNR